MKARRIEELLKIARENGRLSQVYLLYGGKEEDRKNVGIHLSQILFCPEGGCGKCADCQKIINFSHLSVDWIKGEGKYSTLKIEQVKEIKKKLSFSSLGGKYRVFIFEIDELTEEANNAFLKVLEEPPSFVIFLILSGSPFKFLPTLLSRCQKLRLNHPNGRLEREERTEQKSLIARIDRLSLNYPAGIFNLSDEISERFKKFSYREMDHFFSLLSSFYRDALIYQFKGERDALLNPETNFHDFSTLKTEKILNILKSIQGVKNDIFESVNSKLTLDTFFINLLTTFGHFKNLW